MTPFKTHTGIVAILDRGNIDTDQIISKEFLKSIKKTGFGEHLFYHWRYTDNGQLNKDFELNNPAFKNASILITGNNFGCGSSREHAVWAIIQFGFKVVIAPTKKNGKNILPAFADIFKNNSLKNGLLPIECDQEQIEQLKKTVLEKLGLEATVNLQNQTIMCGKTFINFNFDETTKKRLLEGLDDIGLTEKYMKDIIKFEKTHLTQMYNSK